MHDFYRLTLFFKTPKAHTPDKPTSAPRPNSNRIPEISKKAQQMKRSGNVYDSLFNVLPNSFSIFLKNIKIFFLNRMQLKDKRKGKKMKKRKKLKAVHSAHNLSVKRVQLLQVEMSSRIYTKMLLSKLKSKKKRTEHHADHQWVEIKNKFK